MVGFIPPPFPPFRIFGESGRPLVGVYIPQAPFVKTAIFGFKFKVLLGYSQQCNLVIWSPQALPNKMPKTVCRNSVWFKFYGTLKSAHLGPENVSFFLCFFRLFGSPDLIRVLLALAPRNLVHIFLPTIPICQVWRSKCS